MEKNVLIWFHAIRILGLLLLLGCLPHLLFSQNISTDEQIEIREAQIPMADGTKLAADLYLPEQVSKGVPLPVLLEYLPYRKDEGRGDRYSLYSFFLQHGYIVARVDIRGTGRSEGKLVDGEYSEQEQIDGEQVIDWLSKQDFSTGKIAMFGISWGGFNSLHLAMRHPPALKTIISLMSTDDIYEDDAHFLDGLMHIDSYEIEQDLANAMPGAPDFIIDQDYYINRFDTEPWLLKYKRNQTDGPFWNRASLNEDYSRIAIPTFIIGGWYDGYRDFVPRMLKNSNVPIKAIIGPWNHTWPNSASPGPAIEWREMAVRWLDFWVKDIDTGVMADPSFYYYQREYHLPGNELTYIPGNWKQADGWPIEKDTLLYLEKNHGLGTIVSTFSHPLKYKASEGIAASGSVMWWGDWAPDQHTVDANSLVYDSAPVSENIEILGFPEVLLQAAADAPYAHWLVRLSDVAPDGQVTQITGAGFNAAHRNSSEKPEPLVKDTIYPLHIELHATSWTFQKGHKIRLAINNAQWPMIWPSAYPMTTTLHSKVGFPSFLKLPLSPKTTAPLPKPFPQPVEDPKLPGYVSLASETLSGFAEIKNVRRDEKRKTTTVIATNSGSDQYPWGIIHYAEEISHEVGDDTPAEAKVTSTYTITVEQADRRLQWTGELNFSSDAQHYFYDYTRRLYKNDSLLRQKNWRETISRQ